MADVRAGDAVPTCTDSSCKEISPDKAVFGANVPPGKLLTVYCTTKDEDERSDGDAQFCKNNVSNPHPESQAEADKYQAEFSQCLKDRSESRHQKKK